MNAIQKELKKLGNKERAALLQGFFKTGKGEYGEGDVFLGITVPETREVAKKHSDASNKELKELLNSKIHEERLAALLIMIHNFEKIKEKESGIGKGKKKGKENEKEKKKIVEFYLKNKENINNWDLVDLSSHKILGKYLVRKDKKILYKLAKSKGLWDKRISIIACFAFIDKNDFKDALKISKILLNDEHDLIHKAVGWMLREIGKRDLEEEEKFLKKHYKKMPRTMLRYAIERFSEKKRKAYLQGEI